MARGSGLPSEIEQALHTARLAVLRLDDRAAALRAVLEVNPELVTDRNAAELSEALRELHQRVDAVLEEFLGRGPLGKLLRAAARSGIEVGEAPDRLPAGGW